MRSSCPHPHSCLLLRCQATALFFLLINVLAHLKSPSRSFCDHALSLYKATSARRPVTVAKPSSADICCCLHMSIDILTLGKCTLVFDAITNRKLTHQNFSSTW